jgi:DNA-binding response OmpR family regulator
MSGFTSIMREKPDLVILDLGMPAGGGFSLAQRMRSIPAVASTPVIIVTANDDAAARERAASLGALAFVPKPMDLDLVLRTVDEVAGPPPGSSPV